MAFVMIFNVPGMNAEQYDATIKGLEAAGASAPDGRLYHVAAATETGWMVVDVWESMEQFERFGETLVPVLHAAGVEPAEPEVHAVHNIIA